MTDVTENYPSQLPTWLQKVDAPGAQAVPVSERGYRMLYNDQNNLASVVSALGRAIRLQATIAALTPVGSGINGKAFKVVSIDSSGLARGSTDLASDLNKTFAAAIEKIAEGGGLTGTPANTAFFAVNVGVISGSFVTNALYGLDNTGGLTPYVGGAFAPVAIGVDTSYAFVDMGGRFRVDNTTLEFTTSGVLGMKEDFTVSDLILESLIVSGTTADHNLIYAKADAVGIGTSSPAYKLDVAGSFQALSGVSVAGTEVIDLNRNITGTNIFGTDVRGTRVRSDAFNNLDNSANIIGRTGSQTNIGNGTQIVALDTGNVGVGAAVPSEKLHVGGNILASGKNYVGATGSLDGGVKVAHPGTDSGFEVENLDTTDSGTAFVRACVDRTVSANSVEAYLHAFGKTYSVLPHLTGRAVFYSYGNGATGVAIITAKAGHDIKLYPGEGAASDESASFSSANGIIFNNTNADRDFNAKGSGGDGEKLFFLDAGNNRLGFGTDSPDVRVSVGGAVGVSGLDSAYYYGSTTSEGSWRTMLSGSGLINQRYEDGSWVTKYVMTP